MGIRTLKENAGSRTPGKAVKAGDAVLPGMCIDQEDNDTYRLADGSAAVLGLALDSNVLFPLQNTSPDAQAGEGYDYLNYNRQGLVGIISNAEVELYDDKRDTSSAGASHPCVITDTFVLNAPVYCTAAGLVTVTSGTTQIGVVTAITNNASATLILQVKLTI